MCHSDEQNHVSYAGSHNRFMIYYGLGLETVENVFSIVFHYLLLLYKTLILFVMRIYFKDIYRVA